MAITLAQIVTEAKELTDEVGADFVADAQWYIWANRAQRKLWHLCREHNPNMLLATADSTIASGASTIALPTGMQILYGVERDPATSSRIWLKPTTLFGKNGSTHERRFWRGKTTITIEPIERAPGTYRVYYVGGPTDMVISSVHLEVPLEPFWDFIPMTMALKFFGKDEVNAPPELIKELNDQVEAIIETISHSNSQLPMTIVDVDDLGVEPSDLAHLVP